MRSNLIDVLNLLGDGKTIQIKPQGYSMYPMFVPGRDSAVIVKADMNRIKRGDVVLYRRDGSVLVLHRIWKVKESGIYLVGDNQEEIEGPLRRDQIKGILIAFIHGEKTISVKNPVYKLVSRGWLFMRPYRRKIKKIIKSVRRITKYLSQILPSSKK